MQCYSLVSHTMTPFPSLKHLSLKKLCITLFPIILIQSIQTLQLLYHFHLLRGTPLELFDFSLDLLISMPEGKPSSQDLLSPWFWGFPLFISLSSWILIFSIPNFHLSCFTHPIWWTKPSNSFLRKCLQRKFFETLHHWKYLYSTLRFNW